MDFCSAFAGSNIVYPILGHESSSGYLRVDYRAWRYQRRSEGGNTKAIKP